MQRNIWSVSLVSQGAPPSCASHAFVTTVLEAAPVKQLIQLRGATPGHMLRSSDSLVGSIVLIIFYGYLLLRGARLLSDGSELLLEVISPGIIGGEDTSRHQQSHIQIRRHTAFYENPQNHSEVCVGQRHLSRGFLLLRSSSQLQSCSLVDLEVCFTSAPRMFQA